jgi:transcriptional regulator with XRE-family HTH domain
LARLRGIRGLKQCELAAASGVTKAMLSSWENSHSLPRLESLERVLNALGSDLRALESAMEVVASEERARQAPTPPLRPAGAAEAGPEALLAQASWVLSRLAEVLRHAGEGSGAGRP